MTVKFSIYFIITMLVIWTLNTININQIFKKNVNPLQARILLFMMGLALSYLVTNYIIDLIESIKIL